MLKTLVATAVATLLSAGAFLSSGANAMTLTAPAGLRPAIGDANAVEQVRHRCYRVRGPTRWVCPRHRRVIVAPYGAYGYYGSPYLYGPTVGIGLGYGWGGGWWGGYNSRVVIHRHHHHRQNPPRRFRR